MLQAVIYKDSMIYNLPVFNFEGLEKTFRKSVTKSGSLFKNQLYILPFLVMQHFMLKKRNNYSFVKAKLSCHYFLC